ncbi:SCO7613 C-terminal domain-containing membrane protein [Micromonospora sp. LOL_021]|uniref:SCO7613 C-terminal domain-containing membrane protein n=1 Tax=Micromonospora sp. LOL_021 TaxID=3345417 RepID=UPI003A89EBD3
MSSTATAHYPCPACGTPASLAAGCPGCGRGPDPLAGEVIRLDGEIAGLAARVEQARSAWATLGAQLHAAQVRRQQFAVQVQAAVRATPVPPARPAAAPAGPPPGPVAPGQPGPAATPSVRPETSTRTVQTILFVLGGLLLGTAAIVFTAVAWASVGVGGRAAILAGVTAVLLALPPLATWRGLRGTAETFAALGLLLVLLDGYAARYVDLFGAADLPAARYAAVTFAVTGLVAAGYQLITGLAAARFAALLAAQPVLPLLAVDLRADAAGTTLLLLGTALGTLAMIALTPPARLALRITGWVAVGAALAAAGIAALAAVILGHPAGAPALAGLPLLAVAAVLVVTGRLTGVPALLAISLAGLAPAVTTAVVRAGTEPAPSLALAIVAGTAVGLALAGRYLRGRLPAVVRTGPWAGALLVTGLLGAGVLLAALTVAAGGIVAARPLWRAGTGPVDVPGDWQLPFAVVAVTGALILLLPRAVRPMLLTVGAATGLLTVPAAIPVPWWAVAVGGLAGGAVAAVRAAGSRHAVVALPSAAVAALLTGHALLVSAGRPAVATAAVAVVVSTALAGAAVARRAVRRPEARWWQAPIGGLGVAVAVAGWPALVALAVHTLETSAGWLARAGAAATIGLPVALVAVRRQWPGYLWYAGAALPVTVVGTLVAPAAGTVPYVPGESTGGYAAAAALLLAVAATLVSRGGLRLLLTGVAAALALPAAVSTLPVLASLLLTPYRWLEASWAGVPAGTGLSPALPVSVPAAGAVTLAVLAAAVTVAALAAAVSVAAVAGHRVRYAVVAGGPVALVALLAALASAGTPWPVVPALSLIAGLAGLAVAARSTAAPQAAVTLLVGATLAGAGLAGLLPTRVSTLTALAAVVACAAGIGAAGRRTPVRVAAGVVAVVAGGVLAATAVRAADLPVRVGGYAVLAVAALALAVGAVLALRSATGGVRGRAESIGVEVAGHAAAGAALLMTVGSARYAAGVCTLWGVVLGARALLATAHPVPQLGGRPAAPLSGGRPALGRPAVPHRPWVLAMTALASEIVAWWLLLSSAQVALTEAYTLPLALAALGVGWLTLRAHPQRSSWLGYAPGLAAALLPSLGSVLVADGQPVRRLLLGAGAVAAVLAGAAYRRQAPVMIGGAVLAVLAVRELVAVWDLLPRWSFLAVGGLALITLAVTYERRRRDLRRLRTVVGRMT